MMMIFMMIISRHDILSFSKLKALGFGFRLT